MRVMAFLFLLPTQALALDCASAVTQADLMRCFQSEYEAMDGDLNDAYKLAMADARSMDAVFPDAKPSFADTLRDAQRAWIPFRDKACQAQSFVFRGGSMEGLEYLQCLMKMTERRTEDLYYMSADR